MNTIYTVYTKLLLSWGTPQIEQSTYQYTVNTVMDNTYMYTCVILTGTLEQKYIPKANWKNLFLTLHTDIT